jgi:hyperosmotically inducible periplasmic protein
MKTVLFLLVCGIWVAGCDKNDTSQTTTPAAPSVSTNDTGPNATTQPDNTGVNMRDQAPQALTAGSQGQGKSDVVVTADIRKRIMAANMSLNAQNVKVVSQNGKVTLRGPVNNQSEKDSIGQIATEVAGADNVDNQLDIKASN